MKKNFITVIVLTIALAVLAACSPASKPSSMPADGKLRVLAVETFLADIAQNVAGERLTVESLMPLGLDPHAFEPAPQDVARISDSDVIIINGGGFEAWLDKTMANAGGQHRVVDASSGVTARTAREGEEAVMSPEERGDQVCFDWPNANPTEKKQVGADAAGAVDLHDETAAGGEHSHQLELISIQLTTLSDGTNGGFLRVHAAEAGDYVFAAGPGMMTLRAEDGSSVEAEQTFKLNCSELTTGMIVELEPGEYLLELTGFQASQTNLLAGPSAGHHHDSGDPHFWLNPLNVVIYVENIRDGLIAADPDGKDIYTANAAAYIEKLKSLDAEIEALVASVPEKDRLLVTNHESFGYFADRYGFQVVGTVIPSVSTGSSPSAQQLARLIDRIRQSGAKAIFLETGSNSQLANQLQSETGIRVVEGLYTHSVTEPGGEAPTYIDMLRFDANTIVNALK